MFQPDRPQTPRDYLRIYLTGIAMGSADIVPGVSGGTMAFILGIYEALLDGIKSFNFDLLRLVLQRKFKAAMDHVPWQFLFTLAAGLFTAILTLAWFLSWMLENEPEYLFAFFFGLILASIIAVGSKIEGWTIAPILGLIGGAALAFILVGLSPTEAGHSTPQLFLSGMVAIMAMILPGISGAFILLLLGQYEFVLNSVKDLDLRVLFSVMAGAVVGLMGFSRVLSWLLKNYEKFTVAVLTGFMIGSLRKIWPWREELSVKELGDAADHAEEFTRAILPKIDRPEFWVAIALMIIGFVLVTALDHMQTKSNPAVLFLWKITGRSTD